MKRKVNTITPAPTTITPAPTDLNGSDRVKNEIQGAYYPSGKGVDIIKQTYPQAFTLGPYEGEKRALILDGEVVLKVIDEISETRNDWSNSVSKLMEIALIKLGQQLPKANALEKKKHKVNGLNIFGISNARQIRITVKEYMKLTHRTSPNEAKKEMIKSIRVLQNTTIAFPDKVNGVETDFSFVVVSGSATPRTKGYVDFNISEEMVQYLYFLDRRRQTDPRAIGMDTHRHPLAKKIFDYINGKYQDKVNTGQKGLGKLRVKTIIENVPLLTSGAKRKKPKNRIIDPLFNEIGYLKDKGYISEYHFETADKTDYNDLADEEINNMTYADYEKLTLVYKPAIN